jgi:hypothetical protein
MTSKLELVEWARRPGDDGKTHLLTRVSFEARSIAIANAFGGERWRSTTIFASKRRGERARANLETLKLHLGGELVPVELDTSAPLKVASELTGAVGDFVERVGADAAVVDVTSFRREELLMLLAILKSKLSDRNLLGRWNLAYVGALNMGDWLSGKVTSVRSVLGFPGNIRPSRSTRLVVLLGFEVNRARSIIEAYEPKQIVLGMGYKAESINDALYARNKELFDRLNQEFQDSVERAFEFSARDPLKVQSELDEVIGAADESNVVIAPLHTKLSTVGAGLYALNHPNVQVCYAPVEEYNEEAYSAPGPVVFLVPLDSIFPA